MFGKRKTAGYKVNLTYFELDGRLAWHGHYVSDRSDLPEIWDEVYEQLCNLTLPGVRSVSEDTVVLVDVVNHPENELFLIFPACIDKARNAQNRLDQLRRFLQSEIQLDREGS